MSLEGAEPLLSPLKNGEIDEAHSNCLLISNQIRKGQNYEISKQQNNGNSKQQRVH